VAAFAELRPGGGREGQPATWRLEREVRSRGQAQEGLPEQFIVDAKGVVVGRAPVSHPSTEEGPVVRGPVDRAGVSATHARVWVSGGLLYVCHEGGASASSPDAAVRESVTAIEVQGELRPLQRGTPSVVPEGARVRLGLEVWYTAHRQTSHVMGTA